MPGHVVRFCDPSGSYSALDFPGYLFSVFIVSTILARNGPRMTFRNIASVKLKVYAARLDIKRLMRGVEVTVSTAHSSVRQLRDWLRFGRPDRLTTSLPCQQSGGSRCLDPLRFCCIGDDRLNRIDELIQSKRLVQHRFRVQAFASRLDD